MKNYWHIAALVAVLILFACNSKKDVQESADPEAAQVSAKPNAEEQKQMRFDRYFFEAMTQKALGNTAKMRSELLNCLTVLPDNPAAHYELARAEYDLGDLPTALNHIQKATALEKNNPWYFLFQGDLLFESGKFKEAVTAYDKVIALDPNQVEVLLDIAAAKIYLNDLSGAIATYNQLQDIVGPSEEVSMQKHQINIQLQDYKAAEQDLLDLAIAFPEETRYVGMLWQFYEQTGQSEKSGELLDKLAKKDPDNGMIQLFLSESLAKKGEDAAAFEAMKKAFAAPEVPTDDKVGYLLNFYTLSEKDPVALDRAYILLDIMEETHPDDPKTFAMYGDFLYRDGKAELAREKYRKAIDLDASRNLLWLQLLTIDSELNDMNALATDSEAALELFPTTPEFYLYRGMALHRLKQHEEAAEALQIGKEIVFDNDRLAAEFYSVLGDVHHARKDHAASDNAYETSLELYPDNVFVLNNYAYYLSLRKANLNRAAELAAKANQLSPGQASFEDTYAWILFVQEKYNEAKIWQEKALSHGGESNGVILEHYGDILFKLGNTTEAIEYWEKAAAAGGASTLIDRKIAEKAFIEAE